MSGISAFRTTEFCRRIPVNEWNALEEKLSTIDKSPITEVAIEAFKKGYWNDPIYKVENWPLLAMECYFQKQLDEDQMAKLALYDACLTYGQNTSPMQGFELARVSDMFFSDALDHFGPDKAIKVYLHLKNLPEEDTQYFKVDLRVIKHLSMKTFFDIGFTPFIKRDGNYFVALLFPPKLAHNIHKVLFPETAIQPMPVLGYFKRETLSHLDKRVASLPLANHVKLPEKLEGFDIDPLFMYFHDISYHHILDSANIHRPIFFKMAERFKQKGEKNIMIALYDGEFRFYRGRIYPASAPQDFEGKPINTPEECFFATLLADVLPRFINRTTAVDTLLEFLKDNPAPLNLDNFREFQGQRDFLKHSLLDI